MQSGALELFIWLIPNWKMIKFDMNSVWSSKAYYFIDSLLKMNKFHMNPVWISRAHHLVGSQLKNDEIWYESSLDLWSSSFDWFLIDKWPSLIWIQPGVLKLITWLALNCKTIKCNMTPAWISRGHYLIDSYLNIDQGSHESSLEL